MVGYFPRRQWHCFPHAATFAAFRGQIGDA